MKDVAEFMVEEINKAIRLKSPNDSKKGKRYIRINTNNMPFLQYYSIGIPSIPFITEEHEKLRWTTRILEALVQQGYLFKCKDTNGIYHIQA